jgi:hypothetical protein
MTAAITTGQANSAAASLAADVDDATEDDAWPTCLLPTAIAHVRAAGELPQARKARSQDSGRGPVHVLEDGSELQLPRNRRTAGRVPTIRFGLKSSPFQTNTLRIL